MSFHSLENVPIPIITDELIGRTLFCTEPSQEQAVIVGSGNVKGAQDAGIFGQLDTVLSLLLLDTLAM